MSLMDDLNARLLELKAKEEMATIERRAVEAEIAKLEAAAAEAAAMTRPARRRAMLQRLGAAFGITAVASVLLILIYPAPTKCGVTRYYIQKVYSVIDSCEKRNARKLRELEERFARNEPVYQREVPASCLEVTYAKEAKAMSDLASTAPCEGENGR